MLFVRGDERGAARAEVRGFACDGDLDSAGHDQEHFFSPMVVGRVGCGIGFEYGLVDFKVVPGVRVSFEDASESGLPVLVGMEFIESADGGG